MVRTCASPSFICVWPGGRWEGALRLQSGTKGWVSRVQVRTRVGSGGRGSWHGYRHGEG